MGYRDLKEGQLRLSGTRTLRLQRDESHQIVQKVPRLMGLQVVGYRPVKVITQKYYHPLQFYLFGSRSH